MESPVLDLLECLLKAADHPDIVKVARYGPGDGPWGPTEKTSRAKGITGVKVTHGSTATASLWEAVWPDPRPVPAPVVAPPVRLRASRLVLLAVRLLEVARPPQVKAWQPVALPDLGKRDEPGLPYGLALVMADGAKVLLRASSTGPTVGTEPDEEPFPDYVIPAEEVKNACRKADAPSAVPASA